jgi:hypothetical protein
MSQQLATQWAVEHEMLRDLVDDRELPPRDLSRLFCEVAQPPIQARAHAWAPGTSTDAGAHNDAKDHFTDNEKTMQHSRQTQIARGE